MKKYCLLLVLAVFNVYTFQPPVKPSLAPKTKQPYLEALKQYYSQANLSTITNGKQHAPLLILFDPVNNEPENSDIPSLTATLTFSLINSSYPILVSGYLLKNLLIRARTYDSSNFHSKNKASIFLKKIFEQAEFTASVWSVFDVPESPFVLLMPKVITDLFARTNKKLGIKSLPSLDNFLPDKIQGALTNQYQELISWLEKNKPVKPTLTLSDSEEFRKLFSYDITPHLERIFDNKQDDSTAIWDIFFEGHGFIKPPIIGGLTPEYFNKILSFFDQKIKTGILFVRSCSAGGQNRTLLETSQDGIQTRHNFTLILGSISDSISVPTLYGRKKMITDFFNLAGFIQDRGTSINNLIRSIVDFNIGPFSYHGATGFPQIWFPGGYGFQTPQIVDKALTIGNVFLRIHKENRQPIIIDNILVVLLYPQIIDVELMVSPFNLEANLEKKWNNFAFLFENSFFANTSESTIQSVINELKEEQLLPNYLLKLPAIAQEKSSENPNYYIYPQIISMAPRADAKYIFSHIKISTELQGKQIAGGVLQFIRDAFFDPSRETDHDYYIDTLTGTNDISLTLAASRILAKHKDKHPLEEILKDRINKEITLKNVVIGPYHNHISFQIDGTTWLFGNIELTKDPSKEMRWNFKRRIDSENYEKAYNSNKEKIISGTSISQKSISEVLYKSNAKILLKKAVELKQKQEEFEKAKKSAEQKAILTPNPVAASSQPAPARTTEPRGTPLPKAGTAARPLPARASQPQPVPTPAAKPAIKRPFEPLAELETEEFIKPANP